MKQQGWTRNLRLKVGAVVTALLATLGFYGLIQAHPLTHTTSTTPASAPGVSSTAIAPAASQSGQASFGQSPPAGNDGSALGQSVAQAPVAPQPHMRTVTS